MNRLQIYKVRLSFNFMPTYILKTTKMKQNKYKQISRFEHVLTDLHEIEKTIGYLVHEVPHAMSPGVEVLPVQVLVHLAAHLQVSRIPGAFFVVFAGDVP